MLRLMDQCMEGASLIDISSMAKSHSQPLSDMSLTAVIRRMKDAQGMPLWTDCARWFWMILEES